LGEDFYQREKIHGARFSREERLEAGFLESLVSSSLDQGQRNGGQLSRGMSAIEGTWKTCLWRCISQVLGGFRRQASEICCTFKLAFHRFIAYFKRSKDEGLRAIM